MAGPPTRLSTVWDSIASARCPSLHCTLCGLSCLPRLSFLLHTSPQASQPEGPTQDSAASLHRRSSTAQQLRPWEVDFRDVRLLRAVGAGSFGKVRRAALQLFSSMCFGSEVQL